MMKALVIEDSAETQVLIKGLIGEKVELSTAATQAEAKELLSKSTFDLILLDISLPDGDGFELCTELQRSEKTRRSPVIFITGKAATDDKVLGFSLGAEDYIVKPFDPLEFRARVEAKLQKIQQRSFDDEVLWKGIFKFSIPYQKVSLVEGDQEQEISLTPHEFRLFYFLARNEGQAFTRDKLLSAVWGDTTHVLDRTVDTHIYTLRKKLLHHSRYIQSIPGEGYRFTQIQ